MCALTSKRWPIVLRCERVRTKPGGRLTCGRGAACVYKYEAIDGRGAFCRFAADCRKSRGMSALFRTAVDCVEKRCAGAYVKALADCPAL